MTPYVAELKSNLDAFINNPSNEDALFWLHTHSSHIRGLLDIAPDGISYDNWSELVTRMQTTIEIYRSKTIKQDNIKRCADDNS